MTAVLDGTITVTCIDCGAEREVQARNDDKIAKRCVKCGQKFRDRKRRQVLPPLKAPKHGFGSTHPERHVVLTCREYPDVIAHYEARLERYGHGTIWVATVQDGRLDADEICGDCPILKGCRRAARAERYTGIAGGRVFKNGKEAQL